uniref:Cell cycle checkpoint protein RAD17 n=1 Tax=Lingulaulax polyedra TaxID=160621 RepID=A0A516AGD6_LINPO|nr:cell cycle checkpoint protein RAD17 [Lingulodinium polyedra]
MAALWAESHQPNSESELVVGKKKVSEVREWLTLGAATRRRLLVLRGPAGCGKAAVLRGVCGDLGLEIVEWSAAARGRGAWGKGRAGGVAGDFQEPLGDAFLRFVAQTDRYHCLQTTEPDICHTPVRRPRVTLVRDFPFTLVDDARHDADRGRKDFVERFHDLVNSGAVQRAVFCFNDTSDDYRTIMRLFGKVEPSAVATIHFDGVPRTFAQRALEAVAKVEGVDVTAANIPAIAAECGGDLRHALNALQLAVGCKLLRVTPKDATMAGGGKTRRGVGRPLSASRGRGAKSLPLPTPQGGASDSAASDCILTAGEASDTGLRSASLGIFHALGRLLYCKRLPPADLPVAESAGHAPMAKRRRRTATDLEPRQLPPELLIPKASRPPLYFVPEDVLAASSTEPSKMVDWLFTNAPRFFGDVGDLSDFATALADADALDASTWRPGGSEAAGSPLQALVASVQVRSLLDANLHPVQPTFADPCTAHHRAEMSAFNMARPLMRDVARHRQRRHEELNAHLEGVDPRALGAASAGPSLVLRTLPFVHLLLCASRGMHPTLRYLPHPLMQAVKDLSEPIDNPCFVGDREETAKSWWAEQREPPLPASWGGALMDDPIEGPDG